MVSVCMATYNGEQYLKEQIDSILSQLKKEDELVISDDMSSDGTNDIIHSFYKCDNRIKYYRHDKQKCKYAIDYATRNFENAIAHCRGDIIFLSDQDDIWLPNKYSVMLEALNEYDIVISGFRVIDQNKNVLIDSYVPKRGYWLNLINNTNNGCCMAFKRSVLQEVFPFPKTMVGHDFWIGVYGGIFFKRKYIDEPLLLYRRHEGNVTPGNKKSTLPFKFKIEYRLMSLWCTIKGIIKHYLR